MSWWPVRARGESRGCSVCVCFVLGLGLGRCGWMFECVSIGIMRKCIDMKPH